MCGVLYEAFCVGPRASARPLAFPPSHRRSPRNSARDWGLCLIDRHCLYPDPLCKWCRKEYSKMWSAGAWFQHGSWRHHKPGRFARGQSVPVLPPHEKRRSKRVAQKKSASLVVNLDRIPKRVPCLIVDSSPEGFRLAGTSRLRRGQIVEIIPDEDPLNASRCSVIWIGKQGSSQEGQVGLRLLDSPANPRVV